MLRSASTTALSLPRVSAYATFIVKHHLEEFATTYMEAFLSNGIDLENYFPVDETKTVREQFLHYAYRHLRMIANDQSTEQIREKLKKFFPAGNDTLAELQAKSYNIFQLAYIRKTVLKKFLTRYSSDIDEILEIITEMDQYTLLFERATSETYLHHLKELLNLREEQLLEAQHLSGTGSFVWYVQDGTGEATPELLQILEISSMDELKDHGGNVHKDDWRASLEKLTMAIRTFSRFEFRYRFSSSNGERIVLVKGKVEGTRAKTVIKGTAMDITEMEQMVRRLEESQALYKEAQSLARMGNWSWDSNTGMIRWSEEVYRICEMDPLRKTLNVRSIRELAYEEDWKEMKRQFRLLREKGEPLAYIGSVRLNDGREKILEVKAKRSVSNEGIIYLIGTVQDVTWEQSLIRTLQENQKRYRHMESIASIGNWQIDFDKNDLHITDEFLRIYGVEADERPLSIERVRSFITGNSRKELDVLIERCRLYGTPYQYQFAITTASGEQKILMTRGEAIRDADGHISRIAGTAQDITKEQRLLDQLQHSEVLYKQAQTIGRIGNWVMEISSRVVEWSDEVYHIFELNPVDKNFDNHAVEMIPATDRQLLDECIDRCRAEGVPFDCQYRVMLQNGRVKYLRSKGELLPEKPLTPRQMVGTVQDITEQVLTEKQLREHQYFTQKITDIAPSIIAVLDITTGQYAFVSLAIEKLLGYSREEILEKGTSFINTLIHPEDVDQLTRENAEAIAAANQVAAEQMKDEIVEFKYRLKHKDGSYRWIQTFGTVFERDESGNVSQILNISIDITGEKQAEQVLNQKNILLQQSNSSLEEFAYIASHDLQEPLRKISTFGNMLETLQEESLSDSGKLYLRKIVDSSIRMQGMINDLLSVSLISGNRSFHQESLQQLLDESLLALEYKIEQTNAVIDVPEALPEAHVIAAQFRQLFQNLISNSLKFAREGVAPLIKITYQYITGDKAFALNVDPEKRYLEIRVEDNGIGFSNNYAGKIFAIFQRLNGKSEYEGTGIGLAVCKKIAEHHNGIILASGEPGQGAVFTITIPG